MGGASTGVGSTAFLPLGLPLRFFNVRPFALSLAAKLGVDMHSATETQTHTLIAPPLRFVAFLR
jgi:hypothetical protein